MVDDSIVRDFLLDEWQLSFVFARLGCGGDFRRRSPDAFWS